jgi:type I restriction enzyme S subunit
VRFPAYPKYKPTGVEWLGAVPEHWEVKRGRFCMQVNPPSDRLRQLEPEDEVSFIPMDTVGEYGGLNLEFSRPLGEVGATYTEFQDGDVLVAKITPCFENGKGALANALTNGVALGTTELHVLRALPDLERRFLFYLTISSVYRKTGEAEMYGAGGQKRVPPEFNKNFPTPLPPLAEQRAIANFLASETAKLDTLVAKRQELIEKLKEKRSALISRTVTRGLPPEAALAAGLNPDPKLKPAGIEWLGEIPEHWDVVRIGRKITLQRGVDITKEEQNEGSIPVVSSGGISSFHDKALACGPGVIVGRKGTAGSVYYIKSDFWPHDTTLWVREFGNNFPKYVYYKLCSMDLESFDTGSSNPTVNRNLVHPVLVSWPPEPEQRAIADYLDRETNKIDQMVAKVEEAIERLQEYRTALITAAVTGKIDVRNVRSSGENGIQGMRMDTGRRRYDSKPKFAPKRGSSSKSSGRQGGFCFRLS